MRFGLGTKFIYTDITGPIVTKFPQVITQPQV